MGVFESGVACPDCGMHMALVIPEWWVPVGVAITDAPDYKLTCRECGVKCAVEFDDSGNIVAWVRT